MDERLIGEIARQRSLADAIGSNQHGVGAFVEEVEGREGFESGAVAALGPTPIEVAERFEAADAGVLEPAFQAAAGALGLFPIEQGVDPAGLDGFWPMGQQAVQPQRRRAGAKYVIVRHRPAP